MSWFLAKSQWHGVQMGEFGADGDCRQPQTVGLLPGSLNREQFRGEALPPERVFAFETALDVGGVVVLDEDDNGVDLRSTFPLIFHFEELDQRGDAGRVGQVRAQPEFGHGGLLEQLDGFLAGPQRPVNRELRYQLGVSDDDLTCGHG